jgi:hypothetical protein
MFQGGCSALATGIVRYIFYRDQRFNAPVPMQVPIVSDHFGRMHRPVGAIAARQGVGWAVSVAAPANALGVLGADGKILGHVDPLSASRMCLQPTSLAQKCP